MGIPYEAGVKHEWSANLILKSCAVINIISGEVESSAHAPLAAVGLWVFQMNENPGIFFTSK